MCFGWDQEANLIKGAIAFLDVKDMECGTQKRGTQPG
jgi:hypothetical protein